MRNLFHQTLGFVLGLAFGLLGVVSAVSVLIAYVSVKLDPKPSEVDRTARQYKTKSPNIEVKNDVFDHKFDTRAEAEELLENLKNIIDERGSVTIRDLKIGIGMIPNYTDHRRGWLKLSETHIIRGLYDMKYKIVFPPVEVIKEKV